jgi:hypothetical protein
MAVVTSRTSLNQGSVLAVASAVFAAGTGADIRIHTSASNLLPALASGEFFEVRDHSSTQNNGLYVVVTVNTSTDDYECDKVSGAAPITGASEAIVTLGATGTSTEKSVFFDTAALKVYLLEQGNLSVDGVTGQAVYSFCMQEWKDDSFLIANGPFPMFAIDSDAGKYIIGQNASGNNSGFNWEDNATHSIRTRKLLRNMGWDEVDSAGNTTARYFGAITLGAFEDPVNDNAYYQFGTDTTVDDTVNFDFNGPVNEAVKFFEEQAQTDLAITATTITRVGGSFITEGYKVGGQVTIRNAEDAGNNGTHVLTGVTATVLTTTGLTINVDDTTAILAVDNSNAVTLRLRVRDGDPNGKTFAQANLASAGRTILGNFIYAFPLANATDLDIAETDANIDANVPYTGMSITYHATPQARAGLVGGSFNFGIIINANNGTAQEVYEFVQRQLRLTTDIDADADTAIGRTMDGLMRFVGPELQVGSTDGGLTFPNNPDGTSNNGVYIDNLNAASANNVIFYDNTGTARANPETIAITLDFNQVLIDDNVAEYDLFYDRTIRTSVSDLVVNSGGTITSAGTNLPTNSEIAVGAYVRLAGLTGGDAVMNGVFQISAITSAGADWSVVRYDNATMVTTSSAAVNVDQHPFDTPDSIIVHTNVGLTATTISFTAPDTVGDTGNGFGIFASGDKVEVEGTVSNDGIYEVDTAVVGTLTFIEQTLTTEAAGSSFTITKIVSGLTSSDFTFSYDFDGNTQGGRTVSTNTFVKAKAVGDVTAQYTESTVQTIQSGLALTIPLTSQIERNVAA